MNIPEEFVQCCAVSALGKFILAGDDSFISKLREYASDRRWRIREFEEIACTGNKVMRKIVKENLKKNRLNKMDKIWVDEISQVVSL